MSSGATSHHGEGVDQRRHALQCANLARASGADDHLVAARFGPGAARPVALHVLAKRYRCTLDPKYKAALSPASVRSQQAQGGLLDPPAIARFEASRDAPMPWPCGSGATGRRGDGAKDPDRQTDGIVAFLTVLQRFAVIGAIRPVDRRIINSAR